MTREIETWLSDSRVGYNSVVDHQTSLHCVIVLTDVMSDHIGLMFPHNHFNSMQGNVCVLECTIASTMHCTYTRMTPH